jgi:hypothetical protein
MSPFQRTAALAALALAACGGSSSPSPDIRNILPADNEVPGWTRSGALRVLPDSQATIGTSSGGLDGAADPFHRRGLVQVALQDYANGSSTISLLVWQMTSKDAVGLVYADESPGNEQALQIGDASRIASTGNGWRLDATKGAYYVGTTITPNSATTSSQLQTFVGAVVAKVP